jgi:hypothetical protein
VRGQRLTIVYHPNTSLEWFETDVFLPKSKADITWRFAKPAERVELDWAALLLRAGGVHAGHDPAVKATPGGGPAKKRKQETKGEVRT